METKKVIAKKIRNFNDSFFREDLLFLLEESIIDWKVKEIQQSIEKLEKGSI